MLQKRISRRDFIGTSSAVIAGAATLGIAAFEDCRDLAPVNKSIVSIVRIKNGNIEKAVFESIDLLGGIDLATKGQNSILLKPNLVAPDPTYTTKPEVVAALAKLLLKSGKEVCIGEGTAAAKNFNVFDDGTFITKKRNILDRMQEFTFEKLGYTALAKSLNIPLINLHSGDLVEIPLSDGLLDNTIKLNKKLRDVDLVCSVPVMKTHVLATVTLSMKNLIGLYPGVIYYAQRSRLHDRGIEKGSPGVAFEILDVNSAVKTGLSVIDASTAMEGNGPTDGSLVDMGLIIAGTSPLATDLVGSALMGFRADEVPVFSLAHERGMLPKSLAEIEIRGLKIEDCRRNFEKPNIITWTDFGFKEI